MTFAAKAIFVVLAARVNVADNEVGLPVLIYVAMWVGMLHFLLEYHLDTYKRPIEGRLVKVSTLSMLVLLLFAQGLLIRNATIQTGLRRAAMVVLVSTIVFFVLTFTNEVQGKVEEGVHKVQGALAAVYVSTMASLGRGNRGDSRARSSSGQRRRQRRQEQEQGQQRRQPFPAGGGPSLAGNPEEFKARCDRIYSQDAGTVHTKAVSGGMLDHISLGNIYADDAAGAAAAAAAAVPADSYADNPMHALTQSADLVASGISDARMQFLNGSVSGSGWRHVQGSASAGKGDDQQGPSTVL